MKKVFLMFLLLLNVIVVGCSGSGGGGSDPLLSVATPSFDPAEGTYSSDQNIIISCSTNGAAIYYTTDGSTPTSSSLKYSVPIAVSGDGITKTIKALAIKSGMSDSSVSTATYVIDYSTVAAPSFNPVEGTYSSDQNIVISCSTNGATIYYTTDGNAPTTSSSVYSAPIVISGYGTTNTIKAFAVKSGMSDSNISIATYSIVSPGTVTTFAGSYLTTGHKDASGTAASFNNPAGIATDGINLYIADTTNNMIRKIVISTGEVTTLAGSTTSGHTDATGTAASFKNPMGLATDGINLYVADSSNNMIRKIIIATGAVTTLAGSTTSGHTDATGTLASFYSPAGIAIDSTGANLYVSESGNSDIRKIVLSTREVTTFAGSYLTTGHTDATGTAASFYGPQGITIDSTDTNLYVSDTANTEIRKIVIATGEVTTLAGSTTSGHTDAIGSAASFRRPVGIATDGTYLYVADMWNHMIRKIAISTGEVTTLAGSTTAGHIDAIGTAATFNNPQAVTIVGINVYIVDTANCEIRKIYQ
jgi:sugar lactone lactonase YvrE